MRKIWSTLVLAAACSGGGGDDGNGQHVPATENGAGEAGAAGQSERDPNQNGSGSGGAAGEASEATGGALPGAGGTTDSEAGQWFELAGAPQLAPPGVCAPDLMLNDNVPVELGAPNSDDVSLLSMTADELSVAFSTGSGDELALYVADRSSTDAEFTSSLLALPDGYQAQNGVTLSSDGLRLTLVMKDHSGFGELRRETRTAAFGLEADVTAYVRINSLKPMSGRSVGWPVLSSDEQHLYYLSYFGQGLVYQSTRDEEGVFDFGAVIDEFTLGGAQGAYKLPNGLSADERAIFFFDEATEHTFALFRSRPNAPFYDPLDLGERRGAAPNLDCSRVYSSADGELVLQSRK
jgi:hypothetical protein